MKFTDIDRHAKPQRFERDGIPCGWRLGRLEFCISDGARKELKKYSEKHEGRWRKAKGCWTGKSLKGEPVTKYIPDWIIKEMKEVHAIACKGRKVDGVVELPKIKKVTEESTNELNQLL